HRLGARSLSHVLHPAVAPRRRSPQAGRSVTTCRWVAGARRGRAAWRCHPWLVVQRRRNGYAVPAGWIIPRLVLVAAAPGAPMLGGLPHGRPRGGTGPGRGAPGDRRGSRGREGGSVERSAAALARQAAGGRHFLLAGHRVQRPVLLGLAAVAGVADRHPPGGGRTAEWQHRID